MSDNFYCAAPWRGLHINPRGDVKTCCAGNPNMLGNLNTNNMIEILNSDLMTEIRSEMSQGRAHTYCSNCVQAERFGADSERKWHNDQNPNFDYFDQDLKYCVIHSNGNSLYDVLFGKKLDFEKKEENKQV